MNTEEMIAVMQAFVAGKDIEFELKGTTDSWRPATRPNWNWELFDYRVKPEWVPEVGQIVLCSSDKMLWYIGVFMGMYDHMYRVADMFTNDMEVTSMDRWEYVKPITADFKPYLGEK